MPSTAPEPARVVQVAVGVVRAGNGDMLLSRRLSGTHLAGFWELPGGKIEPGETGAQALTRELREELGIEALALRPLIRHRHHYPAGDGHPARQVVLHAFEVSAWTGEANGRQGQALRWVAPDAIDPAELPAASGPLLTAARLPDVYAISGDYEGDRAAFLARMDSLAARGVRLACLRCHGLAAADYRTLAAAVLDRIRSSRMSLLLHGDVDLALSLGAAGVHLPAGAMSQFAARPLPPGRWLAASCHTAAELEQASRIGCDFAVLSPVAATASHPGQAPLGWARFAELANDAALPVYALGGMRPEDVSTARARGGRGVAVLRALWG